MDKRYSEEEKDTREELKKEIKREIKKQNRKLKIKIPWKIQKILIIIAIIALAGGAGAIGMKRYITHESQTTKLGFEEYRGVGDTGGKLHRSKCYRRCKKIVRY